MGCSKQSESPTTQGETASAASGHVEASQGPQVATAQQPGAAGRKDAAPEASAQAAGNAGSNAAWLRPLVAPDQPATGPLAVAPLPHRRENWNYARTFGWAADSSEFGYCVQDTGLGATTCEFVGVNGERTKLHDYEGEQPLPQVTAQIVEREKRGYSVAPGPWLFGAAISISYRALDANPQAGTRAVLEVLASVAGAETPVVVDRILAPAGFTSIAPDAIAVSPDGKALAVLSHAFFIEFSDTFEVRVYSAGEFAGRAFNTLGMRHHKAGRFERAAELFHRAAYARPKPSPAMYNLACALARLQRAQPAAVALQSAIEQGRASVRVKAGKDADFAAFREAAWFVALTKS